MVGVAQDREHVAAAVDERIDSGPLQVRLQRARAAGPIDVRRAGRLERLGGRDAGLRIGLVRGAQARERAAPDALNAAASSSLLANP